MAMSSKHLTFWTVSVKHPSNSRSASQTTECWLKNVKTSLIHLLHVDKQNENRIAIDFFYHFRWNNQAIKEENCSFELVVDTFICLSVHLFAFSWFIHLFNVLSFILSSIYLFLSRFLCFSNSFFLFERLLTRPLTKAA